MTETVTYLREAIAHAPKSPGDVAPGLLGWVTPDDHYVCAKCAGRIMARGCQIPRGSTPIWKDMPYESPDCVTCDQ